LEEMKEMRGIKFGGVASIVLLLSLFLVGCGNKDAAAEKVMAELDSLTTDMVKAIEANPNDAGIDRALQLMEERRDKIKVAVKDLREGTVSNEMKTKYDASVKASFDKFIGVIGKYETELFSDERTGGRFNSMIEGLKALFTEE
jgi:hypothetical protein